MRILVVEDDRRIAEPVVDALRREHLTVDVACDGKVGLELSATAVHDIIVLDLLLPYVGGLDICKALRRCGSRAMVLMMTARDSVGEKVAALDHGADDYIVKPFHIEELLARIRALARRSTESRTPILRHGPLELDPRSAQARYGGRELDLTHTEYEILETLLRHPRRVFSSTMLSDRVGSEARISYPATIKTHVGNLRKKLRTAGCADDVIVTVYGFGYRLADA